MDNKIICPACKKEIVDIAEFRNTMTCPMCNTFLKNNKDVIKRLNAQASKKNSAINSKNFMGINLPAQSNQSTKGSDKKQTPKKQTLSPKNTESKAIVKKEFNQSSIPAPKQQAPVPKEDLSLFDDNSNDYIPPELDALYDDDDYITVYDESHETNVLQQELSEQSNEFTEPDDKYEDDVPVDIWGDVIEDDNDNDVPVTAVLADFDEDDDFSDADILGVPSVTIPDEEYSEEAIIENDENVEDISNTELAEELAEEQTDEQTEDATENIINENEIAEEKAISDLDLFSDLNAVSTRSRKPKNVPPITNSHNSASSAELNSGPDEYFDPDDEEYDDFNGESEESDVWSDNEDDISFDEYLNENEEESQLSIAAKIVKNLKGKRKTAKLPEDEQVIDVNDDIGRKVEKTVFNSNKDGYYSDTQPFIEPEPDIIPSGSLLKVIGIFAGLIFFTAYFIYML